MIPFDVAFFPALSMERHQDSLSATACTDVGMKRDLFLENGMEWCTR